MPAVVVLLTNLIMLDSCELPSEMRSMVVTTTTMATQDNRLTTILLPYRLSQYSEPFHCISMRLVVLRPLSKA